MKFLHSDKLKTVRFEVTKYGYRGSDVLLESFKKGSDTEFLTFEANKVYIKVQELSKRYGFRTNRFLTYLKQSNDLRDKLKKMGRYIVVNYNEFVTFLNIRLKYELKSWEKKKEKFITFLDDYAALYNRIKIKQAVHEENGMVQTLYSKDLIIENYSYLETIYYLQQCIHAGYITSYFPVDDEHDIEDSHNRDHVLGIKYIAKKRGTKVLELKNRKVYKGTSLNNFPLIVDACDKHNLVMPTLFHLYWNKQYLRMYFASGCLAKPIDLKLKLEQIKKSWVYFFGSWIYVREEQKFRGKTWSETVNDNTSIYHKDKAKREKEARKARKAEGLVDWENLYPAW